LDSLIDSRNMLPLSLTACLYSILSMIDPSIMSQSAQLLSESISASSTPLNAMSLSKTISQNSILLSSYSHWLTS
jgi:hypothetical protein